MEQCRNTSLEDDMLLFQIPIMFNRADFSSC